MNKVWRYFSLKELYKFKTLIDGEIYFARADKFYDEYEGAIPQKNLQVYIDWMSYGDDKIERQKVEEEFRKKFNIIKRKVAISCWHLNEIESPAMWETYGKWQGVAVSTTIDKLSKIKTPSGFSLYSDKVGYCDLRTDYKEDYFRYDLLTLLNKTTEFEYEKEYRLVLYQIKDDIIPNLDFIKSECASSALVRNMFLFKYNDLPEGIPIRTNADELIDEVVASPNMNRESLKEIETILNGKFAIRKSVLSNHAWVGK